MRFTTTLRAFCLYLRLGVWSLELLEIKVFVYLH